MNNKILGKCDCGTAYISTRNRRGHGYSNIMYADIACPKCGKATHVQQIVELPDQFDNNTIITKFATYLFTGKNYLSYSTVKTKTDVITTNASHPLLQLLAAKNLNYYDGPTIGSRQFIFKNSFKTEYIVFQTDHQKKTTEMYVISNDEKLLSELTTIIKNERKKVMAAAPPKKKIVIPTFYDILGNQLELQQYVTFSNNNTLHIAIVNKFHPKTVELKVLDKSIYHSTIYVESPARRVCILSTEQTIYFKLSH